MEPDAIILVLNDGSEVAQDDRARLAHRVL